MLALDGGRAPILSIALLGCLPAFIFIVGANRAYGLASCLLVLSFGMIWRMVESPSRPRILWRGFTCLLFAHCVYYDIVFLCAMLAGAALVAIRRRQWKMLGALAGIGAVSGASLMIYLPIIHRGSAYVPMIRSPFFNFSTLWYGLGDALTARSSAHPADPMARRSGFGSGFCWAHSWWHVIQRARGRRTQNQEAAAASPGPADLALFCVSAWALGSRGIWFFC